MNCHEDEDISELLNQDAESWAAFWELEEADEIFEINSERYREEIDTTIEQMLAGWAHGDAVMAGQAYGHYWDVLMTNPI